MIYLASPYSHPDADVRVQRFDDVCRAAATLMRAGIVVFSPIAHSHPIAQFGMPTNWEFWSHLDREFLARCDMLAVLTLPGWGERRRASGNPHRRRVETASHLRIAQRRRGRPTRVARRIVATNSAVRGRMT